jgi:TetR/AcrR family transcriptional regulator, regulator of cefoperazone and chloramphenicol sensitivity
LPPMRQIRNAPSTAAPGRSASRQDGMATRQHMLEVAGEVFAKRGYAHATSKEICNRAGTNVAAVNYHFGGKEALYSAVLVEAHRRLVTVEELAALAQSKADAREKLEAIIGRILSELLAKNGKSSWQFRVLIREILSPSPMLDRMLKNEATPKAMILRSVVAEIMQLPPDHPAVVRSLINVIAPCVLLLIGHRGIARKVLPDLDMDPEVLKQHMLTFALAGLEAVAKPARASLKA